MPGKKQLWILTGGNGAGKSTFFNHYLAGRGMKFINSDLIAKELDPIDPEGRGYEASALSSDMRDGLLAEGVSFCLETVFSHPSKIDFLGRAKASGYEIVLVYIHLAAPGLNEARVHQRVSEGGHSVPAEKIRSRIPRTMKHVKAALPLADTALIFDNSSAIDRFRQIAVMKSGRWEKRADPLPDWAVELLPAHCQK